MSIACLPWYDFEEIRRFTDRFWAGVTARLRETGFDQVPQRLAREVDHDRILQNPSLLLSQTCGYVVATDARDLVATVATPWYTAPGCQEADYRSYVVVTGRSRAETLADLRGARCVINEPWSHSGCNALRALVTPLQRDGRFFGEVSRSGAHVASLAAMQRGAADVASIDCVTFELVQRHRPELAAGLRVLCPTAPAPAPPFVTASTGATALVMALKDAISSVLVDAANDEIREALMIGGLEHLEVDAYDGMVIAAQRARDAGYCEMFW